MAQYGGAYGQQPYGGGYQQHAYQQQMQQPQCPQPGYQQQWQPPQPSQHYGQYGNFYQQSVFSVQAHQAFQFSSVDELQRVYMAFVNRDPENQRRNAVQAEDLMNILNNTQCIHDYFRVTWSRELCSIMIAMLDRSQDGFMQWEEFLELQQCLVAWHNLFLQHDTNKSGYIEAHELISVIRNTFRYQIGEDALTTILKRYSRVVPPGRCLVAFDDFVSVSVRLRAYTDAFRKRDAMCNNGVETGRTVFGYDDFLRCVMCL